MADNEKINEWTVMFFFAGDNALSPLIVAQLKAIKDAGFHPEVDVLAYFDSNEAGVPSRIFNVNGKRKRNFTGRMRADGKRGRPFLIGDNGNMFIYHMGDDSIASKDIVDDTNHAHDLKASMDSPDSVTSLKALENFIGFCAEKYKAKNYILFLIGHGLIVGHDTFLPDDNPVSSISLSELQKTLAGFKNDIDQHKGTLQLLALHSCSMSAVEVAYELQGTAKYMMGSEGISYIGCWPYRQMLMKLISVVAEAKGDIDKDEYAVDEAAVEASVANDQPEAVQRLIEKLYGLSLANASDYALSGYSLDLSLCSLDSDKLKKFGETVRVLTKAMIDALVDKTPKGQVMKEMILLAHWESQSYWEENYTDLFDFCQCLEKRCTQLNQMLRDYADGDKTSLMRAELTALGNACSDVMKQLAVTRSENISEQFGGIVVHSEHSGPLYQYSHGLSVYFPWSTPVDDGPPVNISAPQNGGQPEAKKVEDDKGKDDKAVEKNLTAEEVLARYGSYRFNSDPELKGPSWADFLKTYFIETMRKTRNEEDKTVPDDNDVRLGFGSFNHFGPLAANVAALTGDKTSPSVGLACSCGSIKNYPVVPTQTVSGRTRYVKAF